MLERNFSVDRSASVVTTRSSKVSPFHILYMFHIIPFTTLSAVSRMCLFVDLRPNSLNGHCSDFRTKSTLMDLAAWLWDLRHRY
jgi:hypothetical protein